MAKVGILSMQRIANYGSFLQAYGLKKMLEEAGHDVEFVDYHIEKPIISDNNSHKNKILRKLKKSMEIFHIHAPFTHKIKFIFYKKNFAGKFYPLLGLEKEFHYTPRLDVLIIGSDEVFNCIQSNANVGYSLELFGKNNKADKLISYAASFGNTTLEKLNQYGKTAEIQDLLKKFDALSVRDKNSAEIVTQLTCRKPEYHIDPVLAYDFIKKCRQIPNIEKKEKYLILYAYSGRILDAEACCISSYAKRKSLKIYAVGGIQKCADSFIDCSPFEVLAYFQNAEEIITDTFHGAIFSIITHKRFAVLIRKSIGTSYGNEEKLGDLLFRLKLESHMIKELENIDKILSKEIDYEKTDSIIREEKKKTREYFKKQIL